MGHTSTTYWRLDKSAAYWKFGQVSERRIAFSAGIAACEGVAHNVGSVQCLILKVELERAWTWLTWPAFYKLTWAKCNRLQVASVVHSFKHRIYLSVLDIDCEGTISGWSLGMHYHGLPSVRWMWRSIFRSMFTVRLVETFGVDRTALEASGATADTAVNWETNLVTTDCGPSMMRRTRIQGDSVITWSRHWKIMVVRKNSIYAE